MGLVGVLTLSTPNPLNCTSEIAKLLVMSVMSTLDE
jgi:hypothetical protein